MGSTSLVDIAWTRALEGVTADMSTLGLSWTDSTRLGGARVKRRISRHSLLARLVSTCEVGGDHALWDIMFELESVQVSFGRHLVYRISRCSEEVKILRTAFLELHRTPHCSISRHRVQDFFFGVFQRVVQLLLLQHINELFGSRSVLQESGPKVSSSLGWEQ